MIRWDWKMILAALVAVLVLYYVLKRELGAAAAAVGTAINPLDGRNLAASGVNAVGAAVTGDAGWSLGGALFGAFNDEDLDALVTAPVVLIPRSIDEETNP